MFRTYTNIFGPSQELYACELCCNLWGSKEIQAALEGIKLLIKAQVERDHGRFGPSLVDALEAGQLVARAPQLFAYLVGRSDIIKINVTYIKSGDDSNGTEKRQD
jgi:hypothetical protein